MDVNRAVNSGGSREENNISNEMNEEYNENLPVLVNVQSLATATISSDISILGAGSGAGVCSILQSLVEDIRKRFKGDPEAVTKNWNNNRYMQIFYYLFPNSHVTLEVDNLIIASCMKCIILKYNFFLPGENAVYNDLVNYIKQNMQYVLSIKGNMPNGTTVQPQVHVQCSYKKLKSIFYDKIEYRDQNVVNLTILDPHPFPDVSRVTAGDIIHLPHVAVTIIFPNFEATRQNLHRSDLKLIRFTNDYKPMVIKQKIRMRYKPALGKTESFSSKFISAYIAQLRMMVHNSLDITRSKKVEILSVVGEFLVDFNLCKEGIDTETEYYAPLTEMPYVRYLAQKRELSDVDPVNDIKTPVSIRLQEMIHPLIMFKLKKFRVPFEEEKGNTFKFQMDKEYLTKNQWLVFTCTLCDVRFEGFLASYEMVVHLFSEHGNEPDWTCTICGETFTTIHISSRRWQHICKAC